MAKGSGITVGEPFLNWLFTLDTAPPPCSWMTLRGGVVLWEGGGGGGGGKLFQGWSCPGSLCELLPGEF